jgi:two-component system cell cycle response regulator
MRENVEILIVEDSPTQAMVLDDILRGHGFRTTIVRGAREAQAHLKDHLPALVVSQTAMPATDGWALCRAIKADPRTRGVPVLLLTPLDGPEDLLRCIECGADAFFTKPYDEAALVARVERLLANLDARRNAPTGEAVPLESGGERHLITAPRAQLLDLLFSAHGAVAQRERELRGARDTLREAGRKTEHLHTVALALDHCESAEAAYDMTVRAAADILCAAQGLLSVVEGDSLVVKAASRPLAEAVARAGAYDSLLAWETFRHNRAMCHDSPRAWQARDGFASILSAPLGGIGVVQAVSERSDAFSAEDARLLDLLLSHAAAAVRRIGLRGQLREQAVRDPLTGLYNRQALDEMLGKELKRSRRYGHTVGILMIDIDKFKEINDRYGRLAGDWALKAVAAHLHAQVRVMDSVFRYGGDEFLVIMPESTPSGAETVRQRVLDELAKRNLRGIGLDFPVSISAGAAVWPPDSKLGEQELLAAAERAMGREKKKAR